MNIIQALEQEQLRNDIPKFIPGDSVRVHVKVVEGSNERIQMFEGVVIARQGSGVRENFTVRRISYGVGIERTFQYIPHALQKSKLLVEVLFVEQNFIIFVTLLVKLLVLKKDANIFIRGTAYGKSLLFY